MRTTFGSHPPQDEAAPEQASLERFTTAAERAFLDSVLEPRGDPLRGAEAPDVDIESAPGVSVTGTTAMLSPGYVHARHRRHDRLSDTFREYRHAA
ncbi:hypothetical protein [Streptomyces sp. NPDC004685]